MVQPVLSLASVMGTTGLPRAWDHLGGRGLFVIVVQQWGSQSMLVVSVLCCAVR
jgi:hypothetical protein